MMPNMRQAFMAATFCSAIWLGAETGAQAQNFGWGYSPAWSPYWLGVPAHPTTPVPTPPYFAIHPPVYYGQRVTMTYGDSPLTRLPQSEVRADQQPAPASTPEIPSTGQWIENPFVPQAAPVKEQAEEPRKDRPKKQRRQR